jgi:ribosomal-protein-alanine N-acetyltransferase
MPSRKLERALNVPETDPALIIPFTVEQAFALAELHAQCFPRPWTDADFSGFARTGSYAGVTAWENDKLTGFAIVSVAGIESEILTLGTAPGCRRRGIARTLVNRLCADMAAHGITALFLEVGAENEAAIALYAKSGFEIVGRRPGYYPAAEGHQDALIMRKTIEPGT